MEKFTFLDNVLEQFDIRMDVYQKCEKTKVQDHSMNGLDGLRSKLEEFAKLLIKEFEYGNSNQLRCNDKGLLYLHNIHYNHRLGLVLQFQHRAVRWGIITQTSLNSEFEVILHDSNHSEDNKNDWRLHIDNTDIDFDQYTIFNTKRLSFTDPSLASIIAKEMEEQHLPTWNLFVDTMKNVINNINQEGENQ